MIQYDYTSEEAKRWVKNRKYAIETGITNFGDAFYEPIEVDNMRGWRR